MIMANHPFSRRSLNVLDENGNEGCSVCGRPRDVHPGRPHDLAGEPAREPDH